VLLWGGTLLAKLVRDAKRTRDPEMERFAVLTCVPWMASAPLLVFTYTASILLPLLPLSAKTAEKRKLGVPEWLVVVGFVMTGLYPPLYIHALRVAGLSAGQVQAVANVMPPLALAVMICGAGWAEWLQAREIASYSDNRALVRPGTA
jgi:drug/metabolite transporter (DMT)-like permease